MLPPLAEDICLTEIVWKTSWSAPDAFIVATCFATAVFRRPFCVMKQVCLISPSVPFVSMSHVAELLLLGPGWTITHVFVALFVPTPAGLQTKRFSPPSPSSASPAARAGIWTTFCAVVQFHAAPGQSGPA